MILFIIKELMQINIYFNKLLEIYSNVKMALGLFGI